jgi:hypothetical protein
MLSWHCRVRGVVPDTAPPRAALSALAEPLRRCVCVLVSRSPDWASLAAGAIAAAWPPPAEAAAAKGELLLEAVEELVAAAGPRAGAAALSAALPAFAAALRGHHAGSAERAAAALAAPGVLAAARAQPAAALGALVPLLVGDARKHWSRDVDAARHRALTALRVRLPCFRRMHCKMLTLNVIRRAWSTRCLTPQRRRLFVLHALPPQQRQMPAPHRRRCHPAPPWAPRLRWLRALPRAA